MLEPNQYTFTAGKLTITYTPTGHTGALKPSLSYTDGQQTLNFQGDEIRVIDTEFGKWVSVTLKMTVDRGSTTFSLLIPLIELADKSAEQPFGTVGVNTVHRITPALPDPLPGVAETYEIYELQGKACVVELPLASATGGRS